MRNIGDLHYAEIDVKYNKTPNLMIVSLTNI